MDDFSSRKRSAAGCPVTAWLLVLSGCAMEVAGESAEEPPEETSQAIIGGSTTSTAHKEAGKFTNPIGGLCTAVMITPRVFLTAAHCIGYASRAVGGTVELTAAAGSPSQSVAQVFAFAGDPALWASHGCPRDGDFACSTGAGDTDIALGFLTAPMPASDWTPATMATDNVANGTPVTNFGYGCTTIGGAGGTRSSRGFNWPNSSNIFGGSLCPGDSGGPVYRNSDGKLIAINSAGGPGFTDIYANVPTHVQRILAMLNQVSGGEIGIDHIGGDLSNFPTSSPDECRESCKQTQNCRAATWRSDLNRCFMKSGITNPTPDVNTISFVLDAASSLWGDYDLPGRDIAFFNGMSPFACAQLCAKHSGCKAVTLIKSTGTCCIKASIPSVSKMTPCALNNDCISYMKKGSEAGDHFGADYFNQSLPNEGSCAQSCARSTPCQAYAYTGGTCYYKAPAPPSTSSNDARSALRMGVMYNTVAFGSANVVTNPAWPLASLCSVQCAGDANCQAWSLRSVMSQGGSNSCLLFYTMPTAFTSEFGSMSGIKGMDYLP